MSVITVGDLLHLVRTAESLDYLKRIVGTEDNGLQVSKERIDEFKSLWEKYGVMPDLEYDYLVHTIRTAESIRCIKQLVGPSDMELKDAKDRINQIDFYNGLYGEKAEEYPQYRKLMSDQSEYISKYYSNLSEYYE